MKSGRLVMFGTHVSNTDRWAQLIIAMKLTGLLIFWMVTSCNAVYGQDKETTHLIEVRLDKCTENNPSTSGMNECIGVAIEEWDEELNRYYALLKDVMTAQDFNKIKTAQIAWLKFLDDELESLASVYSNKTGSIYSNIYMAQKLGLIEGRAKHFMLLYGLATEEDYVERKEERN